MHSFFHLPTLFHIVLHFCSVNKQSSAISIWFDIFLFAFVVLHIYIPYNHLRIVSYGLHFSFLTPPLNLVSSVDGIGSFSLTSISFHPFSHVPTPLNPDSSSLQSRSIISVLLLFLLAHFSSPSSSLLPKHCGTARV